MRAGWRTTDELACLAVFAKSLFHVEVAILEQYAGFDDEMMVKLRIVVKGAMGLTAETLELRDIAIGHADVRTITPPGAAIFRIGPDLFGDRFPRGFWP